MSDIEETHTEFKADIYKSSNSNKGTAYKLLNNASSENDKYEQPPLPPESLNAMLELSSHLGPNIEAYIVNVHSKGHEFKPAIDLHGPESMDRVRNSLLVDKLLLSKESNKDFSSVSPPTDNEVEDRLEKLRLKAKSEYAIATSFFSSCNPDGCFTDLRQRTAKELETTGNAYWEILRGTNGAPRSIVRVRSATMRIGKGDTKEVTVDEKRFFTEISWTTVKTKRIFKRFVQIDSQGQPAIWFKEFGDPRIMSRKTGKYYSNLEELIKADGGHAKQATEIFHFSIHACSKTSYGVPRWAGNVPAVLGSRELDETNLDYFKSNAVPAMALLVAGGKFGAATQERLKEFFNEDVKGRKSTHKVIVIEADPAKPGGNMGPSIVPKIDFVPLRDAQINDALFQEYDKSNEEKIRGSFRLPGSLLGRSKFSLQELRYAEDQVFQPLRDNFDAIINKQFLPELSVYFWKFKSNSNFIRDSEVVAKLVLDATREGVLVPDEARRILGKIIQEELQPFNTSWSTQPLPLTLAALGIKAGPAEAVREQGRQDGYVSPQDTILNELGFSTTDPDVPNNESVEDGKVKKKNHNTGLGTRTIRPLSSITPKVSNEDE